MGVIFTPGFLAAVALLVWSIGVGVLCVQAPIFTVVLLPVAAFLALLEVWGIGNG